MQQFTIDYLLQLGAPAEKIVMGVPFYGRTFRTPLDGNIDDDTDGTAFQGPFTREDGFLGYNEICKILSNKTSGWTTMWDPETSQALGRSEKNVFTGLVEVVTFDNSRSIANKVKFATERKLAGIMVWSIDTDDFLGECETENDIYEDFVHFKHLDILMPHRLSNNYPLLRTINEAIPLALEEVRHKHDYAQHPDRNNPAQPNVEENEIPHGSVADHKAELNTSSHLILNNLFYVALVLGIFHLTIY